MKKIIKLLARNPKKHASRTITPIYDLCVVKKSARGRYVYEKLGTFSAPGGVFMINPFRLIFWLSKNVALSGGAAGLLLKNNIFQQTNERD